MNMAARSLAAALAAGNTAVLKSPALAPCTTAVLGQLIQEAGIPPGVVNIVHGTGAEAGAALSEHPDIDMLTFTGSVSTGRRVAAAAAATVTPCVLELGGKSPTIVFDDAPIAEVASRLATGIVEANGQSCDLPSVALVQDSVYEEFLEAIATEIGKLTVGPAVDDPDVGPLISADQRDLVESYIAAGMREGARLVCGGGRPARPTTGWYLEPTVLADVTPQMTVAKEEIFGPVLAVQRFTSESDALALANGTGYGLAAFVWSQDIDRALRAQRTLRAGQVFVNCFSSGDSVLMPFGGFKDSGYGREKGFEALRTYTRTKTVCIGIAERSAA
jgi:acyl-CoA reductase-like NAD-dependent aldehyde dehydrogenase